MVAITIARGAVLRAAQGDLPGIPAPETLRLRDDGQIDIAGPTARNEVQRAARLLSALLSHAEKNVAAPETLWHAEAEHESLERFISALTPFAAPNRSFFVDHVSIQCFKQVEDRVPLCGFRQVYDHEPDGIMPTHSTRP